MGQDQYYFGDRDDEGKASVITERGSLWDCRDLRRHSPTGFEWGYGGSGPAQLALAICVDAVGERLGLEAYQYFKAIVIAKLPKDGWILKKSKVRDIIAGIVGAKIQKADMPIFEYAIPPGTYNCTAIDGGLRIVDKAFEGRKINLKVPHD